MLEWLYFLAAVREKYLIEIFLNFVSFKKNVDVILLVVSLTALLLDESLNATVNFLLEIQRPSVILGLLEKRLLESRLCI